MSVKSLSSLGAYRDVVRRFWNGKGVTLGELAKRISGSSDLYSHSGRRPHASVNFITAHDGFSLFDLVSYNDKVRSREPLGFICYFF